VLVKVHAAGINPVDWKSASTGVDGAGEVFAAGSPAESVWLGKKVMFHTNLNQPGTFSEFVVVKAAALAEVPDGLTLEVAAAIPCPGGTAVDIVTRLESLALKPHTPTVFVRGAAGAVGSLVVQLAAQKGWHVIACASPKNFELLKTLGAKECVDRNAETPGRTFDAVVNLVDGATATKDLELLRHRGVLVAVVGRPKMDDFPRFKVAPSIAEVALGAAYGGDDADLRHMARDYGQLAKLVAAGTIKMPLLETVSWDDFEQRVEDLMNGKITTKSVFKIV
jgi:NADPH:quinone reductase-like Zn-dependent oxidoreductase